MKSVQWIVKEDGALSKFTLENNLDIPHPDKSGVLVQVKACGLALPNNKIISEVFKKQPRDHYCVGFDVSGVVLKVGESVTHVRAGQEVVGLLPLDSSYSGCGEFCIFNEYDVVIKPDRLSFEDAAAGVGDLVKAYTALHYQAHVCGGDTVLVLEGASSFGSIAIQLAKLWGAKVIATVSSPEERSYLENMQSSVAQIIELNNRSNILVSSVMEETGGLGVDVVIDSGVRLFNNDEDIKSVGESFNRPVPHKNDVISCLGISGKWISSCPDLQLDPPDCQQLFLRGASLCFMFDQAWTLSNAQQGRYQHLLQDAVEKLEKGILKCNIAKTVTLSEAVDALQHLGDTRVGKVVVKP